MVGALRVPPGFLWGAAWAAYQVEGNCANTDVWADDHAPASPYTQHLGDAVDHYHRWSPDVKCLQRLGLSAVHLSIEWSRIEPEPGCYSSAALIHYREVLQTCHDCDLSPMVSLFHTASPRWLIREGGWRSPRTVDFFRRYCAHVIKTLGDWMPMVIPIYGMNGPRGSDAAHPWQGLVGAQRAEGWLQQAARACGSEVGFHPFWMATDANGQAVIEAAHQAARDTIAWLRPTVRVGRSWVLHAAQAHAQDDMPDTRNDDFVCLEVMPGAGTYDAQTLLQRLQSWAQAGVACRRWWVTDHAAMTAGAAEHASTMDAALAGLQRCLEEGLPLHGWLYPQALPAWEGRSAYLPGRALLAVDRSTQQRQVSALARYLGQRVRSSVRMHMPADEPPSAV